MKKTLQLCWVKKKGICHSPKTSSSHLKTDPFSKGDEPNLETIIICMLNSGGWRYTIKLYTQEGLEGLKIGHEKKHRGIITNPVLKNGMQRMQSLFVWQLKLIFAKVLPRSSPKQTGPTAAVFCSRPRATPRSQMLVDVRLFQESSFLV